MGQRNSLGALLAAIEDEFRLKAGATVAPEVLAAAIDGLAPWAKPLLEPRRYKCLFGGRGSAKSFSAADAILILGCQRRIRVLCAREFQNSIADSIHFLLKQRISDLELEDFYQVLDTEIRGANGTEFIFKGLRRNVTSIKSMAGLTHVWVEEAEAISQGSWDVLTPTVRNPGSEIWVVFNPAQETDCIYQRFAINGEPGDYVREVNWRDNPHFTKELEDERSRMQRTDPDRYAHIWEGKIIKHSKAQIFSGKWVVDTFEPGQDWAGPYYGADWGFGENDPTAAVRCWIYDRKLWIDAESCKYQLELDEIGRAWAAAVPGIERHVVRADSARPDTIRYVKKGRKAQGTDNGAVPIPLLEGVKKGAGSIADGIEHIRSYEQIVIHERCKDMQSEAMMYQRKVDPLSGDVLDEIIDKHNHLWDSLRYALQPLIRPRRERTQRAHVRANW